VRVTYLGQACTLIEAGGIRLLVDPWLTEGAYLGTWYHSHLLSQAGIMPSKYCHDVDYLFLSHEHQDHCDPATLKHFSPDIPLLICQFETPKFKHYLQSLGFTNIWEIPSKTKVDLQGDVSVTIFGTAEYNNDSAILVDGDGCRVFNETKLGNKASTLGSLCIRAPTGFPWPMIIHRRS